MREREVLPNDEHGDLQRSDGRAAVTREVRVVALGGLGEVGMNCLAVSADRQMLLVDCGVTFPDREPGVDLIHPDFDFVATRADELQAVVLTHGHEDHIGALPYLMRQLPRPVPVHGPAYALALVEERLRETEITGVPLIETHPRRPVGVGPFEVTPYRVTHSIPDATGLVLRAGETTIIHSGDFKIDDDPLDGQRFDEDALIEAGARGVQLLLSDSTNAENEGVAGGERPVAEAIERYVRRAKARVVLGMFASNLHRLGAVLEIARRCGRRVLFLGRALRTHTRVADALQLLKHDPTLIVSERDVAGLPPERLLVVATGSQGEARAALRRLAHDTHPALTLAEGDEVILSSRTIPGRERPIHVAVDAFERRGIRVWTRRDDPALHVSGHACRDEQRRLIELTRPHNFVPVHGSYVHLQRHAALARALGVPNTLVLENGDVLALDGGNARVVERVPTGRRHIQQGIEVTREVLRDRSRLSESGVVFVVLELDADGRAVGHPVVTTRGLFAAAELAARGLPRDAELAVLRAVAALTPGTDAAAYQQAVERAARRAFRQVLGLRPLVHAVLRHPAR